MLYYVKSDIMYNNVELKINDRGETGSSLIQDYISVMSRKGFLFNFSATFTDEIDYATTTYNFNLEFDIDRMLKQAQNWET